MALVFVTLFLISEFDAWTSRRFYRSKIRRDTIKGFFIGVFGSLALLTTINALVLAALQAIPTSSLGAAVAYVVAVVLFSGAVVNIRFTATFPPAPGWRQWFASARPTRPSRKNTKSKAAA